ncbi:MAG: hypothetical protein ACYS32_00630 [Planctomycetota bacterium]|jgi:hypothetical protein
MKITVNNFRGTQPKVAPHLLAENQAQLAENARVEMSDVRSWRDSLSTADLTDASWNSLYQYTATPVGIGTQWLYSIYDLDFAENPLSGDTFERLYLSGGSDQAPIAYANDIDSSPWSQSADYYKIGPAKPSAAATFDSGSTGGSSYRAYVYTYVTRYGEETGPSPVLSTTTYNTGNVVLDGFTQPPSGYALRTKVGSNAPKIRVYRTNSSVTGAEFQYINEFDIDTFVWATGTFTDSVADADLGEVLPTTDYEGIQSDLAGLMSLSNGIFAGFSGNQLYLSEPYLPHAWPDEYVLSFDYDIVGLGYLGTNIVVLTEGIPYLVYGPAPESMQKQKLNGFYPCVSKRSIVSTPFGVAYASYEGLIVIDHNGPNNITFEYLTPTDWQTNYYPSTMHGQFYNGQFFGFYNSGTYKGTFILDIRNKLFTSLRKDYLASYVKVAEGKMYLIYSGEEDTIEEWEGDDYNRLYYRWKSRRYLMPQDMSFTCAQVMVDIDYYDELVQDIADTAYLEGLNAAAFATGNLQDTLNYGEGVLPASKTEDNYDWYFNAQHFNYSVLYDLQTISVDQYVKFRLYVDNVLKFEKNINSDKFFRLPACRGRRIEFELGGYIPVRRVQLAQAPGEL